MSEPFAFLEDEEDDDVKGGIAWLPITLTGLALAGFLTIPILGLFKTEHKQDWSMYDEGDAVEISLEADSSGSQQQHTLELPLTDDLEIAGDDIIDVDETLSSLGENADKVKEPRPANRLSVTRQASATVHPSKDSKPAIAAKPKGDIPALRKPSDVAAAPNAPAPQKKKLRETASRIPTVQKPKVSELSVNAARPTHEIAVQPGDTLYQISRRSGSTPDEIARMNGFKKEDPIRVGQKIRVPGNENPTASKPADPKPELQTAQRRVPQPAAKTAPAPRPVANNPKVAPPTPTVNQPVAQPRPLNPAAPQPPQYPGPENYASQPKRTEPIPEPRIKNPLDRYSTAIAYRVQRFDNINRIADAHATTPEELIELNGRSGVKTGEMLVIPVDNCLIKNK